MADLRLKSRALLFLIIACIILTIILALIAVNLEKPVTKYVTLSEEYVTGNVTLIPITVDPFFKRGLEDWGISTPGGGSKPIYLNGSWLTYSKDEAGGFAYSSILQGCKPYFWGCGNHAFTPIPASSKLYLTTSFMKETINICERNGFAGALVDLWFENFKGDALVIDLYLTRDIKDEGGTIRSVGKGFVYAFTSKNKFGRTYHFNIVLTEAKDHELVHIDKLLLEPIIEMAFESFKLNRSDWWLVSVDAGAEAHYSEIYVYFYCLEVGIVADE